MKLLPNFTLAIATIALITSIAGNPAFGAPKQTYDDLVAQGGRLDADGDQLAAFIDYYDASLLKPTGAEAVAALTKYVHDGLPIRIPQAVLDPSADTASPIELDSYLNGEVLAIRPRAGEIAPIDDPQNKWPFTRLTYFYRQSSKPDGDWVCYAVIHSQLPEDQVLGDRMGRLLYLIREALVEKTGYIPLTDGEPFGVWLARHATGTPGGQEWHNNIYFYDVTTPRSSIEWIREIAHEFSHLGLPAIGGDYSDPEPWANGYYGERLLLRWLHRGAAGGRPAVEAAWGGTFAGYINFDKLLIEPYLAAFYKYGMDRNQLGAHNGAGMRYLIGMLLAADDHAGPKVVGDMLWSLPQTAQVDPLLLYSPAADAMAGPAIPAFVEPLNQDAPLPTTSPAAPANPASPSR